MHSDVFAINPNDSLGSITAEQRFAEVTVKLDHIIADILPDSYFVFRGNLS